MDIEQLVQRLAQLPGTAIGHGPLHPEEPNESITSQIDSFFDEYPALRNDRCYVDFLEKYAGARIENADYTQLVNIYGFTDASIHMYETDGGELVTDGFLPFAQCVYHVDTDEKPDTYQYDFAFDVSGERQPGVHRRYSAMYMPEESFVPHLDGFCSWLQELLANGGRYARP